MKILIVLYLPDFEPCCHLETMEENQLDEEFKKVPAGKKCFVQKKLHHTCFTKQEYILPNPIYLLTRG